MFRSENDIVNRKANRGPDSDQVRHMEIGAPCSNHLNTIAWLIQPSHDSLEALGSNLFLSRCTWTIFNDYVPALYRRDDCSLALKFSVEAVGLATMGLIRREANILNAARRSQIIAIKEIQGLLNSPSTVSRADTLASIMLLATFAGITCDPDAARAQWGKHIRGALAVLNSRPDSVEKGPIIDALRSHVTSSVLVDCQQRSVGAPAQYRTIRFEPRKPLSVQGKSEFVIDMLADLEHRAINVQTASKMILDFDAVDRELAELICLLPLQHPYMTAKAVCCASPPVHIYASHKSARVWNIIRLTKLRSYRLRFEKVKEIQQLLESMNAMVEVDIEQQLQCASSFAGTVIEDICASVPIFLRSADTTPGTVPASWVYSLLWPLSAAHASGLAPGYLTSYLRRQMQIIWETSSFSAANYHKKELDEAVEPEGW